MEGASNAWTATVASASPWAVDAALILIAVAVAVTTMATLGWSLVQRLKSPSAHDIASEMAEMGTRTPSSAMVEAAVVRAMNGTKDRVERIERMVEKVAATQDVDRDRLARIEERIAGQKERIDQLFVAARARKLIGPG